MQKEPLILAFTGTQHGMNFYQRWGFCEYIRGFIKENPNRKIIFHHGGCIGADKDSHEVITEFKLSNQANIEIHMHPAIVADNKKAKLNANTIDKLYPPKKPLDRNDDMARICHRMIATPATNQEVRRSGTWATIRYAKKYGKSLYILYPNGGVFES